MLFIISFNVVYVDDYAMNQNENKTRKYVNISLYAAIRIYVPYNFKFVTTIDHEYRSLSVHHKVAQRGFIEHYSKYTNEFFVSIISSNTLISANRILFRAPFN